jgi:hypothetical protein
LSVRNCFKALLLLFYFSVIYFHIQSLKKKGTIGRMEGIPRVPMAAPEMKVPSQPFPEQLRPAIKEVILNEFNLREV